MKNKTKNQKTDPATAKPLANYWGKRVASQAFKEQLKKFYMEEWELLSHQKIEDIIDYPALRQIIHDFDLQMTDQKEIIQFIMQHISVLTHFLKNKNKAVTDFIDTKSLEDLKELADGEIALPKPMKRMLERIIKQEFIGQLFTDVIHLSIVSFYKKINPFFGGLTVAVLEKQIKGFIGLFIPMVQERALDFVVHPDNQKILMEFCRSIFFMFLSEPMAHMMIHPTEKKQKRFETILSQVKPTQTAKDMIKEAALAMQDHLYAFVQKKKFYDLIKLNPEQVDQLASLFVKISLPQLKRDSVQQLFINEMELALSHTIPENE